MFGLEGFLCSALHLGYDHTNASEVSHDQATQERAEVLSLAGSESEAGKGTELLLRKEVEEELSVPASSNADHGGAARASMPRNQRNVQLVSQPQMAGSELGAVKSDEYVNASKVKFNYASPRLSKPQKLHFHVHHLFIVLCDLLFRKYHAFFFQDN